MLLIPSAIRVTPLVLGLILLLPACSPDPSRTMPDIDPVSPPDATATDTMTQLNEYRPDLPDPPGMVWIPGGTFKMGSELPDARPDESPVHEVTVTGFYMDRCEVTNEAFARFVNETGYITTAEKKPVLEDIMAQQPPGTPPPPDEVLVPGSLVFRMTAGPVEIRSQQAWMQWWEWCPGANWRHPGGPDTSIEGLDDHPVVHISWDDAVAYCEWAGRQLPTEAQWEFAARGGLDSNHFVWGNTPVSDEEPQCNIWQGRFPWENMARDGYERTAPVGSFAENGFGLFDMDGNVWEWCSDWYRRGTYAERQGQSPVDPAGPDSTDHPFEPMKVRRGGSFLCHRDYCSSYRPSARMSSSRDSGHNHAGFRTVLTEAAWREQVNASDPTPDSPSP